MLIIFSHDLIVPILELRFRRLNSNMNFLFIDKFLSASTGLIEAIEAKRLCCAIKKINDVQESQCSQELHHDIAQLQ